MGNIIWRDVVGYEGLYQISSEKEILNVQRGSLKDKFRRVPNGSEYVGLNINGKTLCKKVDVLYYDAFPELKLKEDSLHLEIWKDVIGFEGLYQISNKGRIKSLDRYIMQTNSFGDLYERRMHGKILSNKRNNGNGYKITQLKKGAEEEIIGNNYVHILVAQHFIPNPENKLTVNHIDGNKSNNCVENLEWATYKEQSQHIIEHELKKSEYRKKLTEDEIISIYKLMHTGKYTSKEVSEIFNCNKEAVRSIKNKRTWAKITDQITF